MGGSHPHSHHCLATRALEAVCAGPVSLSPLHPGLREMAQPSHFGKLRFGVSRSGDCRESVAVPNQGAGLMPGK